jgi:hypothetical protein
LTEQSSLNKDLAMAPKEKELAEDNERIKAFMEKFERSVQAEDAKREEAIQAEVAKRLEERERLEAEQREKERLEAQVAGESSLILPASWASETQAPSEPVTSEPASSVPEIEKRPSHEEETLALAVRLMEQDYVIGLVHQFVIKVALTLASYLLIRAALKTDPNSAIYGVFADRVLSWIAAASAVVFCFELWVRNASYHTSLRPASEMRKIASEPLRARSSKYARRRRISQKEGESGD